MVRDDRSSSSFEIVTDPTGLREQAKWPIDWGATRGLELEKLGTAVEI